MKLGEYKKCGHDPSERVTTKGGNHYCRTCRRAVRKRGRDKKEASTITPAVFDRCNRCNAPVASARELLKHKKTCAYGEMSFNE